jgi:hypothetical protein
MKANVPVIPQLPESVGYFFDWFWFHWERCFSADTGTPGGGLAPHPSFAGGGEGGFGDRAKSLREPPANAFFPRPKLIFAFFRRLNRV